MFCMFCGIMFSSYKQLLLHNSSEEHEERMGTIVRKWDVTIKAESFQEKETINDKLFDQEMQKLVFSSLTYEIFRENVNGYCY